MIRELGWWSLREACRQMSEWRALSDTHLDLTMSVNLSAKQLLQPHLVEEMKSSIVRAGAATENLEAGNYRERCHGGPSGRSRNVAANQGVGRPPGHRRFRDRLFLAELPAPLPAGHAEDRPLFYQRSAARAWEAWKSRERSCPWPKIFTWTLSPKASKRLIKSRLLKRLQCKYAQGYYFSRPLEAADVMPLFARTHMANAEANEVKR